MRVYQDNEGPVYIEDRMRTLRVIRIVLAAELIALVALIAWCFR
jgi:hypothetical protein